MRSANRTKIQDKSHFRNDTFTFSDKLDIKEGHNLDQSRAAKSNRRPQGRWGMYHSRVDYERACNMGACIIAAHVLWVRARRLVARTTHIQAPEMGSSHLRAYSNRIEFSSLFVVAMNFPSNFEPKMGGGSFRVRVQNESIFLRERGRGTPSCGSSRTLYILRTANRGVGGGGERRTSQKRTHFLIFCVPSGGIIQWNPTIREPLNREK